MMLVLMNPMILFSATVFSNLKKHTPQQAQNNNFGLVFVNYQTPYVFSNFSLFCSGQFFHPTFLGIFT